MLISTLTTLALRCPNCGRLEFYGLSRFGLHKGKACQVDCQCGARLLMIRIIGRKAFSLQVECLMCDGKHQFRFTASDLWSQKVSTLECLTTGIEIGFIGPREAVMKSIKRLESPIQDITENFGCDKYFQNPDMMYQVLDIIKTMSEAGRTSCGCGGSQLEAEVYPDRVELICPHCGAVGIVFAETAKDLQTARGLEDINLEANSYGYLDEMYLRNKRPVKK